MERNNSIKWTLPNNAKSCSILDTDIETCKQFTNAALPTTTDHWAAGGGNPNKFWMNTYLAKLAEIGVSRIFNKSNSNQGKCTEPDFTIYPAHKKSFDPDLFIELADSRKINLHVKSFPISNDPGYWSWDINPKDQSFINPSNFDFTALAITDIANKNVYLVNIIANNRIYKLLDKPIHKRDMRCLYYEDYVGLFAKDVYEKFQQAKQTINTLNLYIKEQE